MPAEGQPVLVAFHCRRGLGGKILLGGPSITYYEITHDLVNHEEEVRWYSFPDGDDFSREIIYWMKYDYPSLPNEDYKKEPK